MNNDHQKFDEISLNKSLEIQNQKMGVMTPKINR